MRTNGSDETNSRFLQFSERTHKCVGIIIFGVKNYFMQKSKGDRKILIVLLNSLWKKIQEKL